MEKLKPSEEEVIKLGKKIVEELKLEHSVNTLGKWMAHYIAELILKVENCDVQEEKEVKQKECCETILKVWANREHIPNLSTSLDQLGPLIGILNKVKEDEYSLPYFEQFRHTYKNPSWETFVNTIKQSSKNIFELCLYSTVNSHILNKKKQWSEDYESLLDKNEKEMLQSLEYILSNGRSFIRDSTAEDVDFSKLTPKERYEMIFSKMETEIQRQKVDLARLKTTIMSNYK